MVCQACRILLQYLLSHLQAQSTGETVATSAAMLSPKQLLLPIRALCTAESMLQRADQISLTGIMKNAKLPAHIKTSTPGILKLSQVLIKKENLEGQNDKKC